MKIPDGTYHLTGFRPPDNPDDLTPVQERKGFFVAVASYPVLAWASEHIRLYKHNGTNTRLQGPYLGVWTDGAGKTWYEVSYHVSDPEDALTLAREKRQIEIWDCGAGKSIQVERGEVHPDIPWILVLLSILLAVLAVFC